MTREINLTIPGLPPMNTSDRVSPWAHRKLKKNWESHVCVAVLEALGRWPEAPFQRARVTITRCSTSEPDFDNLVQGGKFLLDGLKVAGVIVDDSPDVIGRPDYHWESAPPGKGCVRIRVESIDEGGTD